MRSCLLAVLVVVSACSNKPASTPLTDVTTLEPVRAAFNAKKGEARFLTLLSPT